jgi:hypothetical protein
MDQFHRLDFQECDGIAQQLLRIARLDGCEQVDPLVLAYALGVKLSPAAPRACLGILETEPLTVRFDPRGGSRAIASRVAHELAHLAAILGGRARSVEQDVDAIADAIQMPSHGFRRAIRRAGGSVVQLSSAYPLVLPFQLQRRFTAMLAQDTDQFPNLMEICT